jgi:hypothetical protein
MVSAIRVRHHRGPQGPHARLQNHVFVRRSDKRRACGSPVRSAQRDGRLSSPSANAICRLDPDRYSTAWQFLMRGSPPGGMVSRNSRPLRFGEAIAGPDPNDRAPIHRRGRAATLIRSSEFRSLAGGKPGDESRRFAHTTPTISMPPLTKTTCRRIERDVQFRCGKLRPV